LTEIRTKSSRPLNVDIDPAGSVTSPSGERQTVVMGSAYDVRFDHSSSGAEPAMRRASIDTRVWSRSP
jgi:hypothetical protein